MFRNKGKYALGVDIGGTNIVFGLVSQNGEVLYKNDINTKNYPTPESFVYEIFNQVNPEIEKLDSKYEFRGIGIGAPNGNFYNGTIEFAPNLKWQGVIPLAKLFESAFGKKAFVTNDANAGALGEMIFGGAKGIKNFLFITLGTGLGSGVVANGELIYGHDGFAGELGHIMIIPDGRECGCGRKGCLETYCSATGLRKTYAELNNVEFSEDTIHSKEIYELAKQGDPIAKETFKKTGEILGFALANYVAFTSPEAIYLYGGLTQANSTLLDPTIKSFEENLLVIYKNKVKILVSELNQNDAALLGAASLVFK